MPLVSVIMPFFNSASYIENALKSITTQTLKDIEIICIDDGSTDKSKDIILDYMKNDARIHYYYQSNQGPGSARNYGMSVSHGEYISFIDSDDEYAQHTSLELLYTKASKKHASICGGSFLVAFDDKSYRRFFSEGFTEIQTCQHDYWFQRFIFLRSFLLENNITFPLLRYYEDPPFLLKALIAANRFYTIPDMVYHAKDAHTTSSHLSYRQQYDYLCGLLTNITLSLEHKLFKIYFDNIRRFFDYVSNYSTDIFDYCRIYPEYISNFVQIVSIIDFDKISRQYLIIKQEEKRQLRFINLMDLIKKSFKLPLFMLYKLLGKELFWKIKFNINRLF